MPAKDRFHLAVRNALIKENWTITHDPYTMKYGVRDQYIDLGAEAPVAAEREGRKIAVEIKSFLGISQMTDLHHAVGQYCVYRALLRRIEPERALFLAVPQDAFTELLDIAEGRDLVAEERLKLLVYDAEKELILQWME